MFIDDQNKELLELQQRRRELEYENQKLRAELYQLRRNLVFNFHQEEVKESEQEDECEKEQIKYILTHSSDHIQKREAEITFLDNPKRLILKGQSDCADKDNTKEFYAFSYSILLNEELEENPKIIATDSKIEIIFDKNQKNKKQLIQQNQ
ncbi:unnamed protein product [Paramecium primaurelia]|uniref:Uncharacterized protein n=1 Tax=Paramecium primaurelia TaxID=5886 RepID=A0A8S1JRV6_PARPR|nr:unnamed protein product [Paramecium primaurelia]